MYARRDAPIAYQNITDFKRNACKGLRERASTNDETIGTHFTTRERAIKAAAAFALALFSLGSSTGMAQEAVPVQITNSMHFRLRDGLRHEVCLSFVNTSQNLITAVRFGIHITDAFGDSAMNLHADRLGEFSPGIEIDGPQSIDEYNIAVRGGTFGGANQKVRNCWSFYPKSQVVHLDVQVTKVLFADGSRWEGNPATQTADPLDH
jgi:hypothetical protein